MRLIFTRGGRVGSRISGESIENLAFGHVKPLSDGWDTSEGDWEPIELVLHVVEQLLELSEHAAEYVVAELGVRLILLLLRRQVVVRLGECLELREFGV